MFGNLECSCCLGVDRVALGSRELPGPENTPEDAGWTLVSHFAKEIPWWVGEGLGGFLDLPVLKLSFQGPRGAHTSHCVGRP